MSERERERRREESEERSEESNKKKGVLRTQEKATEVCFSKNVTEGVRTGHVSSLDRESGKYSMGM